MTTACAQCGHVEPTIRVDYEEGAECPTEWSEWEVYSFSTRHTNFRHPDDFFPPDVGLRRKLTCGTAFQLGVHQHGTTHWALSGEEHPCRWDSVRQAGMLIWTGRPGDLGPDFATRQQQAREFLERYNAWVNGYVYWVAIDTSPHNQESWGEVYDLADVVDEVIAALRCEGLQPSDLKRTGDQYLVDELLRLLDDKWGD